MDTVEKMYHRLGVVEAILTGVHRQEPHHTHSLTAEQGSGAGVVIIDPAQHEHATGEYSVTARGGS